MPRTPSIRLSLSGAFSAFAAGLLALPPDCTLATPPSGSRRADSRWSDNRGSCGRDSKRLAVRSSQNTKNRCCCGLGRLFENHRALPKPFG